MELWIEGYRATGEHCRAQFMGSYDAKTIEEAIEMFKKRYPEEASIVSNGTYWGCRFFDNEADARKSFG